MEQRLNESPPRDCPHPGIHPIHRHQTLTLVLMPRCSCRQEPGLVVLLESLQIQPNIGLIPGTPVDELGEELKELKGIAFT